MRFLTAVAGASYGYFFGADQPEMVDGNHGFPRAWGHFVTFLVTGALLCWNAGGVLSWLRRCLAGVVIAAVLEGFEVAVYHSTFEWRDLRIDCLGVLLGAMAAVGAARLVTAIAKRCAKRPSLSIAGNEPVSVRGRIGGKTHTTK